MEKKGSSFGQKLVLGLVFVLVVCYTAYHMMSLFGAELSTFAAGVTTESTVLYENGYVFRDETVLRSPYSGLVSYEAVSGKKVGKGQTLATVYENGGGVEKEQLLFLDHQIEILERSYGGGLESRDLGEIKAQISSSYDAIIKMLATGELGSLSYRADELLILFNQMNGLSNSEKDTGAKTLEQLTSLRAELLRQGGGSQTHAAEESGYFYHEVDGYESAFTLAAAESLTGNTFYELIGQKPEEVDGEEYGKLCRSSEWILVLPTEISNQKYFEVGQTCMGIFEKNNQTELPLTLENIIEAPDHGSVLLVFRCDRLPDHFSFDRSQSVRLEVARTQGIYVPKSVVERRDGHRGVYVLRGSVVYFRYIDIVYEGKDYYLVREGVEDDGDRIYLKVNDQIILNGRNLFDGRIMD